MLSINTKKHCREIIIVAYNSITHRALLFFLSADPRTISCRWGGRLTREVVMEFQRSLDCQSVCAERMCSHAEHSIGSRFWH